jgi:hypothetical protein
MANDAAVACSLNRDQLVVRSRRWDALAVRALVERAPTETGQRLVFRCEGGVEVELLALAGLEKECCAFADWTVRAAGGQVVLEVRGSSPEAVAAVQAMFRSLGEG